MKPTKALLSLHPKLHLARALALAFLAVVSAKAQSTACYNFVVAQDGSGNFTTVQAALNAVPANSTSRTVIFIKNGTYQEPLTLASNKPNVTLLGQSETGVTLTYNRAADTVNPSTGVTFGTGGSASFFINASGFYANNLTFQNSSTTAHDPALAISIGGDKAVFVNCQFLGPDDTIYGDRCRQYFQDCYITGNTDFIFGPSTAVFQGCELHSHGGTALTAASTENYVTYGYVFLGCKVTADSGVKTDLGRPWRPYAAVSFQNCNLGSVINAGGYDDWNNTANDATARFSEYNNTSTGTVSRVPYDTILTAAQAAAYTTLTVLKTTYATTPATDNWDPSTVINSTVLSCGPTSTPTKTNTPVPPTATSTPTKTPTPVPPTATATFTATHTLTASATASNTSTASFTSSWTPSSTPTHTPVPPTATPTSTASSTATRTHTPVPPTATPSSTATLTNTPVPPTSTFTAVPPTATLSQTPSATPTGTPSFTSTKTNTPVPPTFTFTNTPVPPTVTNTPVPPTSTNTPVPPTSTNTAVPPTATHTPLPPTSTFTAVPPTATSTNTSIPPTATLSQTPSATPTGTSSFTPVPPTSTATATHTPPPSATPSPSFTAVPPTATSTRTLTASATASSTPTASFTSSWTPSSTATRTTTPVPPTATFTLTAVPPTETNTPVPPTATKSPTPGITPVLVFPNPANGPGPVTLRITLTAPSAQVTVLVYTASFRRVNELVLTKLPAGTTDVPLALTDSRGTALANGLYYIIVRTAQGHFTVKLMVLR